MVLCLREPPGGFCDIGCCCCCCCCYFPHWRFLRFQATFPCHQHSTLASQAREGLRQFWALPWLLLVALLFPGFFVNCSTVGATVLSRYFLPTGVFYLTLLLHIFGTFCDSDAGRNTLSRILLCAAHTELSLPADPWTGTTHIVVTRPLVYQLRQWDTKYRVEIELLNMFRLFKFKWKGYKNTLNKTW